MPFMSCIYITCHWQCHDCQTWRRQRQATEWLLLQRRATRLQCWFMHQTAAEHIQAGPVQQAKELIPLLRPSQLRADRRPGDSGATVDMIFFPIHTGPKDGGGGHYVCTPTSWLRCSAELVLLHCSIVLACTGSCYCSRPSAQDHLCREVVIMRFVQKLLVADFRKQKMMYIDSLHPRTALVPPFAQATCEFIERLYLAQFGQPAPSHLQVSLQT
jgi:hypothetical protein